MIQKPIHPYWGILEIAVFAGLVLSGIWVFGPEIGKSLLLQLLFWILVIIGGLYILWFSPFRLHQYPPEKWGWKINGNQKPGTLKRAWPVYFTFTFIAAALLILYTFIFSADSLFQVNLRGIIIKFAGYLVYGTIQSIIFFGFILTRLREIMSAHLGENTTARHQASVIFLTTTIFSLFHIPNIALMACTFLTGIFWAWIFYTRPNILLMGLSHAILGTILHQVVKLHMRIGPFYENPDLYVLREVVPGLKKLIGDLF